MTAIIIFCALQVCVNIVLFAKHRELSNYVKQREYAVQEAIEGLQEGTYKEKRPTSGNNWIQDKLNRAKKAYESIDIDG